MGKERKSKRRRAQEEEDNFSGSDDEFYDRTKKPAKPTKGHAAVLTVKTICSKLQAQEKDAADLRSQLQVTLQTTCVEAYDINACPQSQA